MTELGGYLARAEEAWADLQAAPLSVRKALLCAVLVDDLAGRAFTAWRGEPALVFGAEDVLQFRRRLSDLCPPLGLLADLCSLRPGAPRLVAKPVVVPADAFPDLPVEDYMVSLYNAGMVQRVVLVCPDGELLAHEVIADALVWWRERLGVPIPSP